MTLEEGSVEDLAGNRNLNLPLPGEAVNSYVIDSEGPKILNFTFDLNMGILHITFDEVINSQTTNVNSFTLINAPSGNESQSFTGAKRISSDNYTELYITLTDNDLNSVKALRNLATSSDNVYLSVTTDGIEDISGYPVMTYSTSNPIRATHFIEDTRKPMLTTFLINIDIGNLTLIFSETVNVKYSLDPTQLVFQDSASTTPNNSVTLSPATLIPNIDSNTVFLEIDSDDVTELFSKRICLNESSCYLSFSSSFVSDMSDNPIVAYEGENAINVGTIIIDNSPPELAQFVLFDYDEGLLELRFTKTINSESIEPNIRNITLSHKETMDNAQIVTLTGGEVFSSLGTSITIKILDADLNDVKSKNFLCLLPSLCWVRYPEGIIEDLGGVPVLEEPFLLVSGGSTTSQAVDVIPDTTGPFVTDFDLDLDSDTLILEFNEPVQEIRPSAITIQNAFNGTLNYTLSFIPADPIGTMVTVDLPADDINFIQICTWAWK